ncbi:MAG: L-fucose dehydrogenase [Betaproteobacteria bacterium]|nr:MAG: L-fucose dehydrogenase [Betaproteobacteria bacterium]
MTAIARRRLGRTAVHVTELGFGAAPLGGFRGAVPQADAMGALDAAWDGGIRYFDTSPFYGYGRSELRVGALLRDRPRDAYVISTKVGRVLRPFDAQRRSPGWRAGGLPFDADFDYGYDGAMRSVEQSMLRTGIPRFDVLLVHDLDTFIHKDPDAFEDHYRTALDGALRALHDLRAQGVTRAIGAGMNEAPTTARLLRDADLDCVLLAGRLTLLDQTACDEVVPLCAARGVALVAGGPFNSGILAAPAVPGAAYHYATAPDDVVLRARALERLAAEHGVPLPAAALAFALTCPVVASVIPGPRSAAEQAQILDWHRTPIPAAFWRDAVSAGFVAPAAVFTQGAQG